MARRTHRDRIAEGRGADRDRRIASLRRRRDARSQAYPGGADAVEFWGIVPDAKKLIEVKPDKAESVAVGA